MISAKMDVNNLIAAKPSSTKKTDSAFKKDFDTKLSDKIADKMADKMADKAADQRKSSEDSRKDNAEADISRVAANNSFLAANLNQNASAPNQVSEESGKTLTQNLNNFSGTPAELAAASLSLMAQQASAQETVPAELKEGAFSLEGMELVKPEVVDPNSQLAESLKSLEMAASDKQAELAEVQAGSKQVTAEAFEKAQEQLKEAMSKAMDAGTPVPDATPNSSETPTLNLLGMNSENAQTKGDSERSFREEASLDFAAEQGLSNSAVQDKKTTDNFHKILETPQQVATEALSKQTLDQIVTHARTVLKDGGGEMQIHLNQEGLGKVNLNIGVVNGQVNIAVQTENNKVKKMFEEGIADIRGALETHNLRMESLKVNVAEHMGDKNFSQGQQMSDKDFARNFMGQFRDERQGFKNQSMNGLMDKFQGPTRDAVGMGPAAGGMRASSGRLNVIA